MVRSALLGFATVGVLLIRGFGCAPDTPRIADPTREAPPSPRTPAATSPPAPGGTNPVPGAAGCGLASAAFCDTFSGISRGVRSGDLDQTRWSVNRTVAASSNADLAPFPSTPVSACKSGVSSVTADNDVLVCDAASGHHGQLLTAMSAQNYALLSMRPRQPFDFAGRVGTIAYNVDAVTEGGLSWWTSTFVTDQPDVASSNAAQVLGLLPRNGVGVNFDNDCGAAGATKSGVGSVLVYNNYVETKIVNNAASCFATQRGILNHIEIRLSQTNIAVWASDAGGANFRQIFATPINLPFNRGYVHFQQAERAPAKYATEFGINPGYANNYWSNLGFDGPVIAGESGYSVADALTRNPSSGAVNLGYGILNTPQSMYACCNGASQIPIASLTIPNVALAGITAARLTFAVAYTYTGGLTPGNVSFRYRLNGSAWLVPSTLPDYTAQNACGECPGPTGGGGALYSFVVDKSLLVNGNNTLAFAVDNSMNGYPPIVDSIDLLTFTGYAPT